MDARPLRIVPVSLSLVLIFAGAALGGTFRSRNFVVTAPTDDIARQVALTAEECRKTIAIDWLGKELPNWFRPCPVTVTVGQIGAGGATSFNFDRDRKGQMQVFGWNMRVQGSLERILDSVIPHEVSHTIFACHFRRPLPRWADEGAATLVEHDSERARQRLTLKQVIDGGERIPLKQLFAMKEYPSDMRKVLTLYAEGYSLADFLVEAGGKMRYLEFLNTAEANGWDVALQQHYSLDGTDALESRWDEWVEAGSPRLPKDQQLAATETPAAPTGSATEQPLVRSQSPDADEPEPAAGADAKPPVRGLAALTSPVFRAIKTNAGWTPVESPRLQSGAPPFEADGNVVPPAQFSETPATEFVAVETSEVREAAHAVPSDQGNAGALKRRLKQSRPGRLPETQQIPSSDASASVSPFVPADSPPTDE